MILYKKGGKSVSEKFVENQKKKKKKNETDEAIYKAEKLASKDGKVVNKETGRKKSGPRVTF